MESLRAEAGKPLRIRMAETTQKLHRDLPPTTLWTYGGHYPGPTIERPAGKDKLRVTARFQEA